MKVYPSPHSERQIDSLALGIWMPSISGQNFETLMNPGGPLRSRSGFSQSHCGVRMTLSLLTRIVLIPRARSGVATAVIWQVNNVTGTIWFA
jgi:hypothetical protein